MEEREKGEERNKHRSVWCISHNEFISAFLTKKSLIIRSYCPYVIILSMFAIIVSWLVEVIIMINPWFTRSKKKTRIWIYEFSDTFRDHWYFSLHFYTLFVHYNSRDICFVFKKCFLQICLFMHSEKKNDIATINLKSHSASTMYYNFVCVSEREIKTINMLYELRKYSNP